MSTHSTIPPDIEVPTEQSTLSAGCFSSWLRRIRQALLTESGIDVPCSDCNACCKASYFIHIKPEETQTRTRIPKKLLFPAPGLPKGNLLLGYDQYGYCPMLKGNKCSIYAERSKTCRNFDCRIFAAAGVSAADPAQAGVMQCVRRWKFSYSTPHERELHAAVQAAAQFLQQRAECFPNGVPRTASQIAIVAIKVYDVFLNMNTSGTRLSDSEIAKAIMEANERFEARYDTLKAHSSPSVTFSPGKSRSSGQDLSTL